METYFKAELQFYGKDYDKAKEMGLIDSNLTNRLTVIFMNNYNPFTEVFNHEIERVNKAWDETGKEASFGEYMEDFNPEYIEFIRSDWFIHDGFKKLNDRLKKEFCPIEYFIDNDGCISARTRDMDFNMRLYLVPA